MRSKYWCERHAAQLELSGVPTDFAAASIHQASIALYSHNCDVTEEVATIAGLSDYINNSDTPICCRAGDDHVSVIELCWLREDRQLFFNA